MGVVPDLVGLQLEVYASREGGVWHPEHRALEAPEGWELLSTGDAFVTRRVKTAGLYWSLWYPRDRGHRHRRLVGLLAPAAAVAQARAEAVETAERRAGRRAQGAAYRARKEADYVEQLIEAVVAYLDFAPRYAELARDIAGEAAGRAGEVGSGRVERTRTLSLEQRAALRASAHPAPMHRLRGPACRRGVGRRVPLPGREGRRPACGGPLPRATPATRLIGPA